MDDLQQNIDDIQQQVDQIDQQIYDISSTVNDLNQYSGQLQIPLSPDTVTAINQAMGFSGFAGTAQLSGGSVTVTSNFITTASIILVSHGTGSAFLYTDKNLATFYGALKISAQSNGSFTVTDNSGSSSNFINYLIMNNQ